MGVDTEVVNGPQGGFTGVGIREVKVNSSQKGDVRVGRRKGYELMHSWCLDAFMSKG